MARHFVMKGLTAATTGTSISTDGDSNCYPQYHARLPSSIAALVDTG